MKTPSKKTAPKRSTDSEKAERGMKPTPAFLKKEKAEGEDVSRYKSAKAPANKSAPRKAPSSW